MKKVVFVLLMGFAWQNAKTQNFDWVKSIAGPEGNSITVDASGNVYTVGSFKQSPDFDPGPDTFRLTATNYNFNDIFICKLDAQGNFIWAKQMGGPNHDYGHSIAVDASGNVYTTGYFNGTGDFDPGAGVFNMTSLSFGSMFVSKLDANGNFVWAKAMGGDQGFCIATDAGGNVITVGDFQHTGDFDPGPGSFQLTSAGNGDLFISKLNSAGNFVWAKRIGGRYSESCYTIAVDSSGNIYAAGFFDGTTDFDPGIDTFALTPIASWDIFVSKLDAAGNFVWAKQTGGVSLDEAIDIAVDDFGGVYTTGFFRDTVDFDPGPDTFRLIGGYDNPFISKLDDSGNFVWAQKLPGGLTVNRPRRTLAVDDSGNAYISGSFANTIDFDPDTGIYNLTATGGSGDNYILKLNASGNFVWAERFGNNEYESGYIPFSDAVGNIYSIGEFKGTVDFDPDTGVYNLTSIGTSMLILKLNHANILSGNVLTETSLPVSGVTVVLTGTHSDSVTTDANGRYKFFVEPGGSYTITPSKSNDVVTNNGISSIDVLLMRRHILGIAPLGSPYKIIAAAECNANGDTQVSALDLLFTRQLILGSATSYPTNRLWQFVSSDYVFADPTNPFPFDNTRTYTNITTNQTNQDFIGIKLGDVNGSWDPNIH